MRTPFPQKAFFFTNEKLLYDSFSFAKVPKNSSHKKLKKAAMRSRPFKKALLETNEKLLYEAFSFVPSYEKTL